MLGLNPGDESKGKITSQLAKSGEYTLVARWAGGNNAGHTIYVDGESYKTHLVPSGVFYRVLSLIGPGCVLHPPSFFKELEYLEQNGFDSSLVKVHPNCHIVLDRHINSDKENLASKLGTTSKGIAPVYADKAARVGIRASEILDKKLLWDSNLSGRILCEGAQGIWLDLDHGNYPFVTSSITLPYGASSLGFPPQKIRKIYGAAKIYDTRSGEDPLFPKSLLDVSKLREIADLGKEYGVTTGRRRVVNWLRLDKLIESINLSGTTNLVISKCDILEELGYYTYLWKEKEVTFESLDSMKINISLKINEGCPLIESIDFSSSPEKI